MGKLSLANIKKTVYYLKRNGLRETWNAARERLAATEHYAPRIFTEQELRKMQEQARAWSLQEKESGRETPFFQILVPAYRTNPQFLRELTRSLQAQVYPNWELLILDATEGEEVRVALEEICKALEDAGEMKGQVRYVGLPSNGGISENTNAAIPYLKEGYVGLLDHDDVLTPDALYEMAKVILSAEGEGPVMIYSDEDKWDGADRYYEYHRKEDFNLDLLLSNNYVCHFLVMKADFFRELKLRAAYDGAQDYDLVLRAAASILDRGGSPEKEICHVPAALYHWRCHVGSTAENPRSKTYAYEAGRRALQDFADQRKWKAKAENLKHVGFYRLSFESAMEELRERKDLFAIGGKLLRNRVLAGGRMAGDGGVYYEGLKEGFSGYLHRAVLTQDAEAVDLRCICVREELWPLFESIVGVPYVTRKLEDGGRTRADIFDVTTLPAGADVKALSLRLCKALREQGGRILWDPEMIVRL